MKRSKLSQVWFIHHEIQLRFQLARGEAVKGVITIRWDPQKTPKLEHDNTIWIAWSHDVRGNADAEWPPTQEVFRSWVLGFGVKI